MLAGLAILVLAACTSNPDQSSATGAPLTTTTTAPTTTTTASSTEAVTAFRECMGANGVEIEEVPIDATGRPRLDLVMVTLDFADPVVAEAVSRCSELLETGALDLGDDEVLRGEVLNQLQEFSQCMVDRGVEDFPDPVAGYLGIGSPFPAGEIPYSDPNFAAAVEACRAGLLDALAGEVEEP